MKPPREKKVLSKEKQEHLAEIEKEFGSLTNFFKITKYYKDPSNKANQYKSNNEISNDVVFRFNLFKKIKGLNEIIDLNSLMKVKK